MVNSDYEVVSIATDSVTIRDLKKGRMSVTNDAENVVAELLREGILTTKHKLMYYDSFGELEEITFNKRGFTGFRPGPREAKR